MPRHCLRFRAAQLLCGVRWTLRIWELQRKCHMVQLVQSQAGPRSWAIMSIPGPGHRRPSSMTTPTTALAVPVGTNENCVLQPPHYRQSARMTKPKKFYRRRHYNRHELANETCKCPPHPSHPDLHHWSIAQGPYCYVSFAAAPLLTATTLGLCGFANAGLCGFL